MEVCAVQRGLVRQGLKETTWAKTRQEGTEGAGRGWGGEGKEEAGGGDSVGPCGHGKNRILLNSDEGSPPRAGNGAQTGQRGAGRRVCRAQARTWDSSPGPGTAAQAGTRLSCDFSPERVSRKALGGTGP